MKKFKSFSFYFVFGISALFLGYLLGFGANYLYLSYKFDPVRISKEQALKDVYGGKNPEETYNLFVSALKHGNIELASKYFVLGKQDEELAKLEKIKAGNGLQKHIHDLPKWGEMRENGKSERVVREFLYPVTVSVPIEFEDRLTGKKEIIPKGDYSNSISFRLNTKTNIWKIERF